MNTDLTQKELLYISTALKGESESFGEGNPSAKLAYSALAKKIDEFRAGLKDNDCGTLISFRR